MHIRDLLQGLRDWRPASPIRVTNTQRLVSSTHPVWALVIALFLILLQPTAGSAQSCPSGSFPLGGGDAGWHGCSPAQNKGDDDSDGHSGPAALQLWGAIAIGDGAFGAAEGAWDQVTAENAALERCQRTFDGAHCHIKVSYFNQCAALGWGDEGATAFRGPDPAENQREAVRACQRHTTNCRVFYSACSN